MRAQIENLVSFIATGARSASVSTKLAEFEREAKALEEKRALLQTAGSVPIDLPTAEKVMSEVFNIEAAFAKNPAGGRALLARFFRNGTIALEPQAEGFYLARSELLPLVAMTVGARTELKETALADESGGPCSNRSCAGALRGLEHAVFVEFVVRLAA